MTIDDAMKALALALEPNPVSDLPECMISQWHMTSVKGFWEYYRDDSCAEFDSGEPVNFIGDEDASARLLDALPSVSLQHWEDGWRCTEIIPLFGAESHIGHSPHRKTAIFLAALAWKGIERPEVLK